MHPGRLAEREQQAESRIYAAARALASTSDLTPLVEAIETAHDRDPAVKGMLRKEALADLMEAVAASTGLVVSGVYEGVPVFGLDVPLEGTEPLSVPSEGVAVRNRGGRPRKEAVNV